MATKTSAIADIIGSIKRPEKTVPICLAGDLQAEFESLERDLAIAREKPADAGTLAGGSDPMATAIAQQIQELRAKMREHTAVFRFQGLSSKVYSDLVAQHPPKEESKRGDVDWDSFSVALVATCAVEPKMSVEEAGQLADALTQAQWDALFTAAFEVNKADIDVPFSFAASAVLSGSKKNSR
ncbi:hypothetical protein OG884_18845 [Streptosporangium sp. NBC_01755]|uniref:hypothetical protein n=1 Tax=Streptosporangium sp. NBC_01755 TaxID=2975949 RepID=UPI002DD99334|nr:hypothetical protein [Streptosporangium sp. NBC_01755]WSD03867.1 hypothetical protein OG884_18845 [Streptosporangium sp. NBC_01755]